MAPEISQHREEKSNFKDRFANRYEEWQTRLRKNKQAVLGREVTKKDEDARLETGSALPDHEIHGFENEINSLKNFLLDQKVYKGFKSLVVVGEYGVGKTTLCQTIFNDKDVKSVYAPRIWVSMHRNESKEGFHCHPFEKSDDSKIPVLKRILKGLELEDDMFKCIYREVIEDFAMKLECRQIKDEELANEEEKMREQEVSALLYAVNLNLKWKKYLIVLDDVREEDNWNENLGLSEENLEGIKWGTHLSDGFPKGSGGRVIYTTRDETLAKKLVAEEHEMHRVWPLSDSESVWKIYKEALVKEEKEVPRNDQKFLEDLMNKSRGLPLAARMMGTVLPVFLENETVPQNGSSTHGPTDSLKST